MTWEFEPRRERVIVSKVVSSVLLLDPSGALIADWAESLASECILELNRNVDSLDEQLAEWVPEVLLVHVEGSEAEPMLDNLERICRVYQDLPLIAILGEDLDPVIRQRCLRLPLFTHLEAGVPIAELRILLERSRGFARQGQARLYLRQQQLELTVFELGGSLGALHEEIHRAADCDQGVVIYGIPGSGRGELAKKLHLLSRRAREPFVRFNPSGLQEEDCRVRLFGREGRDGLRRKGSLESADGGTIFIEEVGTLPVTVQNELHRVIVEGRMTRVGGIHPIRLDIRTIVSSQSSLRGSVDDGRFNADLLSQLQVFTLTLPKLSERRDDIPAMIRSYLRSFGHQLGKPDLELAPEVEGFLMAHDWKHGLEELRRSVELAILRAEGPKLELADFSIRGLDVDLLPLNYRNAKKMVELDFKRRFFARLLRLAEGKVTRAAELTGVPRPSLSTMLKEAGVEAASFKPPKARRRAAASR